MIDLHLLTDAERKHLEICWFAYQKDMDWAAFHDLAGGRGNPAIKEAEGVISPQIAEHPLYLATRDLEDRLGIRQGTVAPSAGDRVDSDPIAGNTPNRQHNSVKRTATR
ncbi:MAG: hypothetical protein ACKVP6_13420 [Mycobacterium sp.]